MDPRILYYSCMSDAFNKLNRVKILQIFLFVTVICVSSLVIVSISPVYDIADQDVIVEMENEGEHDEKCHLTDLNYW